MTLKEKKKDGKPKKVKIWTPHRYLVAAARKTWRWSPERRETLKRVKVAKDAWRCELCSHISVKVPYITKKGRKRHRTDGAVDHIVPIGKEPRDFSEYGAYYTRMFCPMANLQFLCSVCHKAKTSEERSKQ